jgi:hypothetical protein
MKILHGQRHPWYIDGRAPHITWVLSVLKMLQVQTKEELDEFIVYRFGKIVYRFGQVSLILDYQYISYHFLWFLFNVMCHLPHFSHVFLHAPLDFWKLCHKNGPVRNATLFSTKRKDYKCSSSSTSRVFTFHCSQFGDWIELLIGFLQG